MLNPIALKILGVGYILFLSLPLYGQREENWIQDSLKAIEYYNIADTSFMNVDKCIAYTFKAVPLLKKTEQWEKYVQVLAGLSYCYNIKEKYDSLEIYNKLTFEEAKKYLTPESFPFMAATNNLAKLYSDVYQDYNKALTYYEKALSGYADLNRGTGFRGNMLKNIAEIYLKKGDFQKSKLYLKASLVSYSEASLNWKYSNTLIQLREVEVLQKLAKVNEYQQKYATANQYLEDALQLMDTNKKAFNSSYYLYCYTNLAEIALKQDSLDQAASFLNKADRLRKLTPQQLAEIGKVRSSILLQKGDCKMAQLHADKAIHLAPKERSIDLALSYLAKAKALYCDQAFCASLDALYIGIQLLVPEEELSADNADFPLDLMILSRIDLINFLQMKAQCFEALFRQEKQQLYLTKALNCYTQISQLSDQLRQDYQSEESKIFLNETTHSFYEKGIQVATQLWKQTDKEDYLDRAFFFLEKSKAAILLEELKAKEADGIFTIPAELVEEDYQLRIAINYYQKLLDSESRRGESKNQEKINDWNGQLLSLTEERETLKEKLQTQYPSYTSYMQHEIANIQEVQTELLSPKHAIVEYYLGEKASYALCIQKDKVVLKILPNRQQLKEHIDQLREHMRMNRSNGVDDFSSAAFWLHQKLIAPLDLNGIEKLTIVPDNELALLPFEILITKPSELSTPKKLDYLIKSISIHYAYSATVLQLQLRTSEAKGKTLVIAPVFKNDPLRYLPHSEEKMTALRFSKRTHLLAQEANVENFKQQAGRFGLLHFWTHATAFDTAFQQPAIEFFDQKLYLSDLYTLKLPAQLAVLTACETGMGDARKGEGVMSLARGFTYAGVPSVVTTLWKVNEGSTKELINHFYRNLSKGMDKDVAMRKAKLDYLEHCDVLRGAPYHWAGLIVIGNTEPYSFEQTNWWWLLVCIGLVSSMIWFLKNQRKR